MTASLGVSMTALLGVSMTASLGGSMTASLGVDDCLIRSLYRYDCLIIIGVSQRTNYS